MTDPTPIVVSGAPVGGGLGARKVAIITVKGDYATGGFKAFDKEPAFMIASGGYDAKFNTSTGKVQLFTIGGGASGGTVTVTGTTITGITFTNAEAITGTVDSTTATIGAGDATVGGSVVVPDLTGTVSGGSGGEGGEVTADTAIDIKIMAVF